MLDKTFHINVEKLEQTVVEQISEDKLLPEQKIDLLKFEYQQAQDMLKHYDTLSWQTGNIFIAGILVFTGLALGKDSYEILKQGWGSLVIVIGIPAISYTILRFWFHWFRRHRGLYRLRDDVLHRLEIKLGFYHFLSVEKERQQNEKGSSVIPKEAKTIIEEARKNAYKNSTTLGFIEKNPESEREYKPFLVSSYKSPSSYHLVYRLSFTLPAIQFVALFLLWWFEMGKKYGLLFSTRDALEAVGFTSENITAEYMKPVWYIFLLLILAIAIISWVVVFFIKVKKS